MTTAKKSLTREVALVGIMAGLANALAFVALPGPLNIQFGLTAIPILLVAFALGPTWGALCGLLGGIVQATKYGHLLYVFYTAIQGGIAGLFALSPRATRRAAPLLALFGGFFLVWWVDILRNSPFTLDTLGSTSFPDAPKVFGPAIDSHLPIIAITVAVVSGIAVALLVSRRELPRQSTTHLALAGCFGAVCYAPYDAWVLYGVQGYPWLPTWFVLSKDLIQDFIAAVLVALLLRNSRIHNLLYSGAPANA
jgi:uncharacterized membrane protein